MGHWLASEREGQEAGVLTRFDAAYWTVDFPRPMMASVVTTAPDALRVDCVFYRRDDLAGLIWAAEDRHDHPLLRYATDRDFRGCRLSFRWRSGGVRPLDAVHGPVLTIEGRDASGAARAWYVRLWNYAVGSPEDAVVAIDFADVDGGFLLPGEADPVWAGDVDRMFVSLVPPGYDAGDAPLAAPAEGWVELSDIRCEGPGSVLAVGDVVVPEHGLGICSGYDDSYHLTPARLLHNALRLGYRGDIVHYVGMSHYFRLERAGDGLFVSLAGGALNVGCAAWHRDFAARALALGYGVIWSLSYELFDAHCRGDWKQRASDGSPALTGWVPPSTLLSPAHPGAMAYLQAVARAFVGLGVAAGLVARFQVGEPWWWVTPGHRICLYDAAAKVALGGDPVVIDDVRGELDAARRDLLDRAGALLAASTAALVAAARAAGAVQVLLLAYLPTILDPAAPEVKRANLPVGWAQPAFDVLQLEDYDWAATGNVGASVRAVAAAEARLGYPVEEQQYFAGFVLRPEDRGQWSAIVAAAQRARARGVAGVFLWALPQVLRDGLIWFDEEDGVEAFDDVRFPLALGAQAEVIPETQTTIAAGAGGAEVRGIGWAEPRTRYDVAPGVRSQEDVAVLLAFFRARLGPARGFRLQDPFDHATGDPVGPLDVALGVGDGATTRFPLVKRYGAMVRRITRPVAGSVRVSVGGVETQGFTVEPGGFVLLDAAPGPGVAVAAGFGFDVPVRFAEDRLQVARTTHGAAEAVSVPLIELREP
ncbi:DUF2460 domain-containing protein [Sphingomonas sp. Leaf25]|uniref:DUF2460 domain-containing protein n=1 Tax=Sphingomonas sp. Leaf25 TaxID=1735692 RepID=UPI0006FA71AD|nr:DUF2460 domain-containing protein [Sphingomonas sp. Leaf25]KQM96672.1 hypothetical protein ASE78_11895 [Sphingomonas sp. Leaf25]